MKIIIGVSFRQAGKVYYFDPAGYTLKRGQRVIVETAKGVEIGTVVVPNREMAEEKIVAPLKKIMRIATPADEEAEKKNQEKEKAKRRRYYRYSLKRRMLCREVPTIRA